MASITVRISDELKKELQDSGVNISEVTRKALKAEVERIQEKRALEAAKKLSQLLGDVPDEEIIKSVRETRDQQ